MFTQNGLLLGISAYYQYSFWINAFFDIIVISPSFPVPFLEKFGNMETPNYSI